MQICMGLQLAIESVWVIPSYGLKLKKTKLPMEKRLSLEAVKLSEMEWVRVKELRKNPWML